MSKTQYWPDGYLGKRRTPAQAISMLRPGQRVFIGSACGEPQALVRELAVQAPNFADLEIVRLLSLETLPLAMIAAETDSQILSVRSFYLGSAKPKSLSRNRRFFTPVNLSMVPRLFKTRRLPVHAALIQTSPPDDFGWMSLGISVDVTMAAMKSADMVIAQVNPNMPRVLGRSFIHVNEVDVVVECEEELLTVEKGPEVDSDHQIGRHTAKLIDDGATLQLPLGATPRSMLASLADKNDLGIHTQFMTNGIMNLVSQGVINNSRKGLNEGKCVASSAIGTRELYEFLNDNPGIAFFPSDYVNDPTIIAQHNKMVSVNVIMAMDLTGQAAADAQPYNHYSGVTGIMDFVRGARYSDAGKSVLMLPSTTLDGRASRIVPRLEKTDVVVPKGDVHYVATEYGLANLFGKTLEERAMAMISIAHPDFRDELFERAKEEGLIGPSRTLAESLFGVYPIRMEETREINGERVMFRPAAHTDGRLIQEHFYNLDHDDVVMRFLREKTVFGRSEVAGLYEIDYVRDLTMVAVIGEIGFEQVIAVGGYYTNPATNMAEVAFSTSGDWQRRGLSKIILAKLVEAARNNGIRGLEAYTMPQNQGMIRLFNTIPYKVQSMFDEDMMLLKARFDEPE